jgi:hypothetical protein
LDKLRKSHLSEEVIADSKENSPAQQDFGDYTYKSLLTAILSSQGLRIERDDKRLKSAVAGGCKLSVSQLLQPFMLELEDAITICG